MPRPAGLPTAGLDGGATVEGAAPVLPASLGAREADGPAEFAGWHPAVRPSRAPNATPMTSLRIDKLMRSRTDLPRRPAVAERNPG